MEENSLSFMEISIKIENKTIKIAILDKKKIVDSFRLLDERDLGERLLPVVDDMLKKNNITIQDIKHVKVKSDQSDSFTTTRLAKTFAKIVNWTNSGLNNGRRRCG
jgi:tRNA A37 threonylcarbamoyladenosine modification protein TsaB